MAGLKYSKRTHRGDKKLSQNQQQLAIFMVVFDKTVIPLALVGYKMIIGD